MAITPLNVIALCFNRRGGAAPPMRRYHAWQWRMPSSGGD